MDTGLFPTTETVMSGFEIDTQTKCVTLTKRIKPSDVKGATAYRMVAVYNLKHVKPENLLLAAAMAFHSQKDREIRVAVNSVAESERGKVIAQVQKGLKDVDCSLVSLGRFAATPVDKAVQAAAKLTDAELKEALAKLTALATARSTPAPQVKAA